VRSSYPGGGAEVVEQGVTTLLEQQLKGLERLESIRSSSSANGSTITLSFTGGDPQLNQINAQNEANQVLRQLPTAVTRLGLQVRRSSDDLLMVLSFSTQDSRYDDLFLSGWVNQVAKERLQRVEGVESVALFGGSPLAFRLWLDSGALLERQLTIDDVRQALEGQNVLAALGQTGEAPMPPEQTTSLPLQMEGRLRSPAELEQLVVGRGPDGGVVMLRDIGRVSLGSETYDTIATDLAGQNSVALAIYQRDGSNALAVNGALQTAIEELRPAMPPGIALEEIVNEAEVVRESIGEALGSLRDSVLLVFVVLLLGLGNSRLALISALAVPVSLLGSITLLKLSGTSINTLSLFGMVLASGLVVDDAIVVSEDIGRRLERGASPLAAARQAMAELGGAVVATSLVLVVVFLPAGGRQPHPARRAAGTVLAAALDRSAATLAGEPGSPLRALAPGQPEQAGTGAAGPAPGSAAHRRRPGPAAQWLPAPGGQRPASRGGDPAGGDGPAAHPGRSGAGAADRGGRSRPGQWQLLLRPLLRRQQPQQGQLLPATAPVRRTRWRSQQQPGGGGATQRQAAAADPRCNRAAQPCPERAWFRQRRRPGA